MARKPQSPKDIDALTHEEATRLNIPTGELQPIAEMMEEANPVAPVEYPRADPLPEGETRPRDEDLDPQIVWRGARIPITADMLATLNEGGTLEIGEAGLVWRGKDTQDWSNLVVQAPPLYIQETIHPKALIADLKRRSERASASSSEQPDLFAEVKSEIEPEALTEFYEHDDRWRNRMILGDSLQVMASLAERERLRGKVQCIYFDPPYGIKFNSNWQVSTRSRDVKDGKVDQITREPEQVKAFRDTWRDGIHSYLTYLRDRLTAMRDLLTDSGSIFVQIGDENVHRVRALMDEVFGEENFVIQIVVAKTTSSTSNDLSGVYDSVLCYTKSRLHLKYRQIFLNKIAGGAGGTGYTRVRNEQGDVYPVSQFKNFSGELDLPAGASLIFPDSIRSQSPGSRYDVYLNGQKFRPEPNYWKTDLDNMQRLKIADRLIGTKKNLSYIRKYDDFPVYPISNLWTDTVGQNQFGGDKVYVVQTGLKVVERCILMATDPGDLVLDPTCGSGTTATVAEQWGRRWITVDTSRVALALARARIMGAKYPWYHLADSPKGREKEQDVSGRILPEAETRGDIRQGFVYERAPHITLKSIANNAEIDVIWEKWQRTLEPLRERLNAARNRTAEGGKRDRASAGQAAPAEPSPEATGASDMSPWEEWQIPRHPETPWDDKAAKEHAKAQDAGKSQKVRAKALAALNAMLSRDYTFETLPDRPADPWTDPAAESILADWWTARIARQTEIDDSIAQKADVEMLYDRPYEDKSKVRVAGPFTVESLSPHRVISVEDEEVFGREPQAPGQDFASIILDNLRRAGVQQATKDERITFTALTGWPGEHICAEGLYDDGEAQRRAGIMIGPEFGSVTRSQLTAAAREAAEARFDTVIACGFNFDAHASELTKLGPLPILKAKMNPDLHMAGDLAETASANLFIVFGEPDIEWRFDEAGEIMVEVLGIDVFDPTKGEVRDSGKDDIAAWFIDTDYDEESFFVRHAYFMGANDPYKSLKTALKAEVDEAAWQTLYRDVSRPFVKPSTGRFAVKVINHFGDEVMKVFEV